MTAVDTWAALAAFVAGSAISIRARMLRPHQAAWTHAPAGVWLSLGVVALSLLMAAVSIWFGAHATPREAMVYSLLAICGVVMLWNLNRNGRLAYVARQRFVEEARLAMEVSAPPARYPGERPMHRPLTNGDDRAAGA